VPKSATSARATRATGASRLTWMVGPAFVAGVAYIDPGNVASNVSAGARFGYLLVWVVVLANLTAWLVQYLSAKLGVVTGLSLPELLGRSIRNPWGRRAFWLQAELVAMATDIAEVIGGAIALALLFGLPLVVGGAITGAISFGMLLVQSRRGARPFEFVVIGLVLVITVGFCVGVFVAPPDWGAVAGGLLPRFAGGDSVLLAVSILGATIMPHVIYGHSAFARDRFAPASTAPDASLEQLRGIPTARLLRATRWDVTVAMLVAGAVNVCLLLLAAANLGGAGGTDTIEGAHAALRANLGPVVATVFAIGLLASGLASSAVGAYAGSEIMHGLLRVRVPLAARRLVTLVPALVILAAGVDPTFALVLSQVALSFGIPFALVPLVVYSARRSLLGRYRSRPVTTALGAAAAVLLTALNALLLWLLFTGL